MRTLALLFAATALLAQPIPPRVQTQTKTDCAADGSVVNAITGEPVIRAHVFAPRVATAATTDGTGHWSLSDIACGRFQLNVTRPGYLSGGSHNPVTLESGSPVHDIKIQLTPQSVVTGVVSDESGDPVMGAQVTMLSSRVLQGRRTLMNSSNAVTNDLGEFRLSNLAAGKYIFCARVMNDITLPRNGSMANAETCYPGPVEGGVASAMDLPAGRETRVDFVLRPVPAVHIRGAVIGMPKSQGAAITLQQRGFSRGPANTKPANVTPDGKFDMQGVTPGSYVLATDYWEAGTRLTARVPVDVGNSDVEGVVVNLEPGLTIKGSVRVESVVGQPLPSRAWNPVLRSADPTIGGGQIKWDKERTSFTIADITAGSYRLEGMPPAPFYIRSAVLGGRDILREEAPITQSGGEIEIVLADDSGSIEGTVEDRDGQPASGASAMVMRDGRMVKIFPAGPDGHFMIGSLAPGDYRVYAWDDPNLVEYLDTEWMKQQGGRGQGVSVQASQKATVKLVEQIVPH